jgi:hypothetical protein
VRNFEVTELRLDTRAWSFAACCTVGAGQKKFSTTAQLQGMAVV